MSIRCVLILVLCIWSSAASAQWNSYPTPGIPRTADGKPDLAAPTPRPPDGRPDLSGLSGSTTAGIRTARRCTSSSDSGVAISALVTSRRSCVR
jgi:hypothetical protein